MNTPHAAVTLLFWMLVAHALADFPLQGSFLARAKNHRHPIPGVPWIWALYWHALIHAGGVALVTGNPILAVLELWVHWLIDHQKCEERFGFTADQLLHIACKVLWVVMLVGGLV